VEVRRRMTVRRVVAATDVAAGAAQAQIQPDVAGVQAVLATERTRRDGADAVEVCAQLLAITVPLVSGFGSFDFGEIGMQCLHDLRNRGPE
jgi:hypothetical protein